MTATINQKNRMARNTLKIEHYQDTKGEFRWRMKRSGRVVADCGEGYKRRLGCLKAVASIIKAITDKNYVIEG